MNINEAFPSKYIGSSDLQGRNVRVTISHTAIEEVGKDKERKLILYFKGKEKGMILNKTNAKNIASAFGDETDNWGGNELILFTIMTEFGGNAVEGLRVRQPQPKDNIRQSGVVQKQPAMADAGAMDDEIPF